MGLVSGVRQPGGWKPFPYNGARDYQDFGGVHQPVQYRINAIGQVELRGNAKKATAGAGGQIIGTLPAGYRPPATISFPVVYAGSNIARVDVNDAGAIIIQAAVGAGQVIALSGICFYPAGT